MSRLVARFNDGSVVKGATFDFSPSKDLFHMALASRPGENPLPVHRDDLKALFFVKDFDGDPTHVESLEFESPPPPGERRIRTAFKDGEVLVGTTSGYRPDLPGFFLIPADPESNNERCFIFASAAREVRYL